MNKILPFNLRELLKIIEEFKTPFYIYNENGIRNIAKKFNKCFSWIPGGFINYFAVKACPNPHILKILEEESLGLDCSSFSELLLAEKIGSKKIMFSSNNTPIEEFRKANELNAIINIDDLSQIDSLEQIPEMICFRYNPGSARDGNKIIGKPEEAKFGMSKEQLIKAYKIMKNKGVKKFGLHTMLISNELDVNYFIKTVEEIFNLVVELNKLGISITFVDFGGGIGIPYKLTEKEFDLETYSKQMKKKYESIIVKNRLPDLRIAMECGRFITGPHGYLVSKVRHVMHKYKDYIGLDASMADLMRPALYGAYHHISVVGKENLPLTKKYDLVGSLCENNDKFAIDRKMPEIKVGDIIVFHDVGAHGHAMGFNYNGQLKHAELLLCTGGEVKMIRRAETFEDYIATIDFK